jgi:hypothetical protein
MIGEVFEEFARPQIQFPRIPKEDSNVIGSLLEVHRLKSFLEKIAQPLGNERFVPPMPGLAHSCFEMCDVRRNLACHIPNEVVEIPPLHTAFPSPAEHRVKLAREEATRIVESDLIGSG